jgi:hypothetical protein
VITVRLRPLGRIDNLIGNGTVMGDAEERQLGRQLGKRVQATIRRLVGNVALRASPHAKASARVGGGRVTTLNYQWRFRPELRLDRIAGEL